MKDGAWSSENWGALHPSRAGGLWTPLSLKSHGGLLESGLDPICPGIQKTPGDWQWGLQEEASPAGEGRGRRCGNTGVAEQGRGPGVGGTGR